MNEYDEFKKRENEFLKKTGLKRSKARKNKVLRCLYSPYCDPSGFDHTRVYFYPPEKWYILMTEPYHSVDIAIKSLAREADVYRGGDDYLADYSYVVGPTGSGLWNPGYCIPLLIGKPEMYEFLKYLADNLSTKTLAQ